MRRVIVGGIAALGLLGAAPVVAPAAPPAAQPSAAFKSWSGNYMHGMINSQRRCVGGVKFCSRPADRHYHRYGFHCHRRDSYGHSHLTQANSATCGRSRAVTGPTSTGPRRSPAARRGRLLRG